MDINDLSYSPELLATFGVSSHNLPEIKPSVHNFGLINKTALAKYNIKVHAMLGD